MAGHERHKILDALVSVCSAVSLVKSAYLRPFGSSEPSQSARPFVLVQPLTDVIKSSLGVESYHKLLIRLKLSVPRDDAGTMMIDIIEKLEDKLRQNHMLGGTCDFICTESVDPPVNLVNGETSIYIQAHYRRVS